MSAHDSTIIELLTGAGYYDPQCYIDFVVNYTPADDEKLLKGVEGVCGKTPNVSSSLVFELVKDVLSWMISVRFAWDGEYINVCNLPSNTPSGKYDCPIYKFHDMVDRITLSDTEYHELCSNGEIGSAK